MKKISSVADKVKVYLGDGLQNLLTGMGVPGMDKSVDTHFVDIKLSFGELEDAYSSDWLVGKVCDLPPFDMTRSWRTMNGDMEPRKLELFLEAERVFNVRAKFQEAMTWSRLYGGSGIILNIEDGIEPFEPLDFNKIKKGSLRAIITADRQFLTLSKTDNNPMSENYGYPETYRLAPTSVEAHHSRVIRFDGVKLPLQSRRRNGLWGKSIIERLYTALRRAGEVQENIGTLLHEATVDVIRIPDLMTMLSDKKTEIEMKNRFGVAKIQKSVNRMLLLDSEEEYEQHQQTFTGLNDILEKFLNVVAGAADIPITRLFGQSPGGMNSSGESDLRNYYDHLSARQETDLRPKLSYFDQILYRSLFGQEPKAGELSFEFNPLWQMSEQEQAELENQRSNRDETYLNQNVINESIVAKDLMERGTYSAVNSEYIEEMEKLINKDEDEDEPQGNPPEENENEEEDDK